VEIKSIPPKVKFIQTFGRILKILKINFYAGQKREKTKETEIYVIAPD
jgi:hypothetical protein